MIHEISVDFNAESRAGICFSKSTSVRLEKEGGCLEHSKRITYDYAFPLKFFKKLIPPRDSALKSTLISCITTFIFKNLPLTTYELLLTGKCHVGCFFQLKSFVESKYEKKNIPLHLSFSRNANFFEKSATSGGRTWILTAPLNSP